MENRERMPDLNEVYVASPIRMVPPVSVDGQLRLGFLSAGEAPYKVVNSRKRTAKEKKWKPSPRLIQVKPLFDDAISKENRKNGDRILVSRVLMYFDAMRRRLRQVKNKHGAVQVTSETFNFLGLHTNRDKRIGAVPGVDVGDIFYCWGEMDVVGLHMAPISVNEANIVFADGEEDSVVISVVNTGNNADQGQNPYSLVVTGYGGTAKFTGQEHDQQLVRLNLKLHNAMRLQTSVRVIRSVDDKNRRQGKKIYIYDGVYVVMNMWEEEGKTGYNVFKFLLVRHEDQKPAFGIWKDVEQWKTNITGRPNILLQDLSYGVESLKICLVNEVDDEEGPTSFTYMASLQHSIEDVRPIMSRCHCVRQSCCLGNCLCMERNGGEFPYLKKRILVTRRPMVYECGGSCGCSVECENKLIQTGIKFSLEVFKTRECGWGLRSWDPIRAGSFICEYAGEVVQNGDQNDDYRFDTSRIYNSFQWNYIPETVEEVSSARVPEEFTLLKPMMISAKRAGNVARFMNHGCTPNVLWQPISREQGGKLYIHIGFFAIKHIPPLTELRYDYGKSGRRQRKKKCMCGSENCRGSFGG